MKRKGSEKVRYGVSEGSWWYSLQPDEAEIWDLLNHRGSGTEGAERKKHKWESERKNVHLRRGAKYTSLRQAKMQESIQTCTYTVCILSVCIFSGANNICQVSAVWGERVMCLGRELSGESGEGVSEAAVWTDIGCRLSFALCLSHKRTQQQRHQPHSWGRRELRSVREWLYFLFYLPTQVHWTGFVFLSKSPLFDCGKCSSPPSKPTISQGGCWMHLYLLDAAVV